MYGTVARIRPKEGRQDDIVALHEEWEREFKPKVPGAVAGYLYRLDDDPHEMIMVAVFEDKDSYRANAESPEQDTWYRRFRDLLEEDPVWQDGEIVAGG